MHFKVGEGDFNGTSREVFSQMLAEFNTGAAMDDVVRVFSSKNVTKEMKEMWMEICTPVYKYCEAIKNRQFEVRIRRYERRHCECGQHDSALASLSMAFSGGERRGLYPAPPPALPKRIWIGTCTPSLC